MGRCEGPYRPASHAFAPPFPDPGNAAAGVPTQVAASVVWPTWGKVWAAIHALTVAGHIR